MKLPRVLVVDDQYSRDKAERAVFLRHSGLVETSEPPHSREREVIGTVVFSSGQRDSGGTVTNDYEVVRNAVEASQSSKPWSLVLLDARFESGPLGGDGAPAGAPGDDSFGEEVRRRLAADFPDLPLVMLSSKSQRELQDRDTPYLSKQGLDPRAVAGALLRFGALTPEQASSLLKLPKDIVAVARPTLEVFRRAFESAATEVSVLLLGESGVGKEVVARYVHNLSPRSHGPFVALNVAAVPSELLESELFGHIKGAFTGALAAREGRFQQAHGGTLFLDEIGDMPLEAQAKVLRALQEREVCRVGGDRYEKVNIRLVSATSRDLSAMIAAGQFREDLYYRVNTFPLSIPALRERPEDIPVLAAAMLARFGKHQGKGGIALASEALERLKAHSFPGNVRELENLLQRLLAGAGSNSLILARDVEVVLGDARHAPARVARIELSGDESAREPAVPSGLGLAGLPTLLDSLVVEISDPELAGAKPRLEEALARLLRRVAGAAVERCRDPVSGKPNRQRAMQLFTGERDLKGKGPQRVVNQLLGRLQEADVGDDELERLVRFWQGDGGC